MTPTHFFATQGAVVTVRFWHTPNEKDLILAIDDIATRYPAAPLIWDLGDEFDLTGEELRRVAEHGRSVLKEPARVALVAPSDLAFGLSRMYQAYREDARREHRVFRSVDKARAWILSDSAE